MKTLKELKERGSKCIDGRDFDRLFNFIPEDDLLSWGWELKEKYKGTHIALEWTKENILIQLEKDVKFGFEKATDGRGISSAMMAEVVKMWNWVLEEGLEDFDDYAPYGMPLFIETSKKYGFNI